MTALHRSVAATLIVTMFFSSAGTAHAQSTAAPAAPTVAPGPAAADTMASGLLDGEMLAEGQRTGGNLGAGLAVGVLTGLIGTGIGYFVVGPSPLSPEAVQRSVGKSADYQFGLKTGGNAKRSQRSARRFSLEVCSVRLRGSRSTARPEAVSRRSDQLANQATVFCQLSLGPITANCRLFTPTSPTPT